LTRRIERGKDSAVGNAASPRTAVLDAPQMRCKPTQIGNFARDSLQVVFGDAIDARTSPARLNRETQKIPELVECKTQVAAAPDELQAMQVFPLIDSVISTGARRGRHELDVLVIAYRHNLNSRRLRQFSDAESLI
jgi:hypothetical protein